jgi:hypothetical protein
MLGLARKDHRHISNMPRLKQSRFDFNQISSKLRSERPGVRDHALLKASELGPSVSVVVVNRTGVILVMETADSAPPGASEASIMKARKEQDAAISLVAPASVAQAS